MSKDVAFSSVSTIIPRSPPDDDLLYRRRRRQTDSAVNLNPAIPAPPQRESSWTTTDWTPSPTASYFSSGLSQTESSSTEYSWRRQRRRDLDNKINISINKDKDRDRDSVKTKTFHRHAVMFMDDPRDAGKAVTLTSAGTSDSPSANSTTATPTTTARARSSNPNSSLPPLPRLPQSRFSFEYRLPKHKRSLTSSSAKLPSEPTLGADPTPTPLRNHLYDRSRRSATSLDLSNARDPTASVSSSQLPSPLPTREQNSDFALPPNADSANNNHNNTNPLSPNESKRRRKQSLSYSQQITRADAKRRMPSSTVTYVQDRTFADDRKSTLNGVNKSGPENASRAPIADESRSKNEDIFLNIARSDSGRRDSGGRSELRRSRLGLSNSNLRTSNFRANEQTPSPDQLRSSSFDSPLHSHNDSPLNPYSALPYSYSASAHPLEDHGRSRHSVVGSSSRSTIGLPRSRFNRTSPDTSPHSPEINVERRGSLQDPRLYRHSTLSNLRSSRQPSSSEVTERAQVEVEKARQDGTDSTLSTTAPSTVWDELEDLKSRIKKLELTGKLPPSSQAAISTASGERPRTATTTVTTISSSPNHNHKISIPSAEPETIPVPNPVHPLLQSALIKAKTTLSSDVYKALEVTVADALALSTVLGSNKTPSGNVSVVNGYGPSDRQSRRKADSVCRSLTELCLALSDDQLRKQQTPGGDTIPETKVQNIPHEDSPTPTLSYRRSMSHEPESISRRQSTNRITSRLEVRRASLANINTNNNNNGNGNDDPPPLPDGNQKQSPVTSVPKSRLSRLSTLRTRRPQPEDESDEQQSPHGRSVSRAMTEIGSTASTLHVSPRQRFSHGYTTSQSVNQPQQQQPRTPTALQSNIPLRRSTMTPTGYTPAIPRSNILAGSRRYAPASAAGSVREGARDSPQQGPSQTRITAPSNKSASSYTPIQQNRMRTNSMGVRTFKLRHQPSTANDDSVNTVDVSID